MFAFVCVLDCLRLVLVVCTKCAICPVRLLARSLVRLSDDSMRRYHLKFNSIKCSTGSTFYSIYLANCVCIRVLSDVKTAILSLAASVFFAPSLLLLLFICWFALSFFFFHFVASPMFIIANIFFGSHSSMQPLWQCCIECRLRTSTYWIMFNGRLFFSLCLASLQPWI